MFGLGPWELVLILLIVIAVFGAGRLAGIGNALGSSVKEFKKAVKDEDAAAEKKTETGEKIA
jgi:sec-independent protein translocase protein TatA